MKLFRTLKELPILIFWEVIDSQNTLLLDREFNDELTYTPEQKAEALAGWTALYDDYFLLENDAMTKAVLRENFEVLHMLQKINFLKESVDFLMMLCNSAGILTEETFDEVEQMIYSSIKKAEPRINIQYFAGVAKNITTVVRVLNSLKNTFEIKHKRNEKDVKKIKQSVFAAVAAVAKELGIQLNVREMCVEEWVEYKRIAITQRSPRASKTKTHAG